MRQLKISISDALLNCAKPHTECPDRFITWSAFSIIGATLKNRVFINDGLYTLYPNQYIVLVSPPGIGKGTAINFAWNVIRDTAPNVLVNIISDRVTAPRIIERIATGWNNSVPKIVNGQIIIGSPQEHTCTIFSTELGVLVGASEWMLDFLCESWDRNKYDYDTKNKGTANIANMCTSLIGATVPDYIQDMDKNGKSIKGGFSSRCLFIYEDAHSRYIPFPPPISTNSQSVAMLASIKNDLEHIAQNLAGEYTYNAEAKLRFENFLKSVRANVSADPESIANFKSRIRAHTLKLAMILSAARKDSMVIDGFDMANAIVHMTRILEDVKRVFRGSGDSELALSCGRVEEYLDKVGVASKKDILCVLHRHITQETLERILHTMTYIGKIGSVTQGKTIMYQNVNGKIKNP